MSEAKVGHFSLENKKHSVGQSQKICNIYQICLLHLVIFKVLIEEVCH